MKKISTGQLIRNIRESLNMSQRGLGRASGLCYHTIRNVEDGETKPQMRTLELIILAFKIENLKQQKAKLEADAADV